MQGKDAVLLYSCVLGTKGVIENCSGAANASPRSLCDFFFPVIFSLKAFVLTLLDGVVNPCNECKAH